MAARKTIGFLGATHVSGSVHGRLISPGGSGTDSTAKWLPSGLQWGTMGHARVGFDAASLANGPFTVNQVITGGTSLAKARVIEVLSSDELVVERMAALPPLVGFQTSFKALETITADNSPATSATVNYVLENSQFVTIGVALTYDQQGDQFLASKVVNQLVPNNAGANVYWDRGAKLAATIGVASGSAVSTALAATGGIGRLEGATSGAKGLVVNVSENTIYLANVSGTFQNGENLRPAGGGSTITTVSGTITTKTLGEWVPYAARPNLAGIGRGWEFPPAGGDTCWRAGLIGVEPIVMEKAYAKWGDDLAAIKLDVNGPNTGNASGYGGVTYGLIKCSGTFPTLSSSNLGATLTASGSAGWSATLVAYDAANKYLWVKSVSPDASLAAGTVTIGSGGGAPTATATGNVIGWMKGAAHWVTLLAEISNATAKLPGGDTLDWQMMFAEAAEGDTLLPMHDGTTSAGHSATDMTTAWLAFAAALRSQLSATGLVVVAFAHRSDHRATSRPNVNFLVRTALRDATRSDSKLRYVIADDEQFRAGVESAGAIVTPAEVVYLETMGYPALGPLIWDAYTVANLSDITTDFGEAAVVLLTGQSQMVARIPYSFWLLEDDPELGKIESLSGADTRDENQLIWNSITGQWEVYSVLSNATTFGNQVLNYCSMEVALLNRLRYRYGRIYCIKVPFNGSTMNPASNGYATWGVVARLAATASMTVTVPTAGKGRFTAASGAPFASGWTVGHVAEISGAATGFVGAGGNNTYPAPTAVTVDISAVDPSGAWIEFTGTFVADASAKTITITKGPLDLRTQAGAEIHRALLNLVTSENKIPRHVATVTWQGESDVMNATGYLEYALSHIDWCRSVFGHTIGNEAKCPHVWLKVGRKTPFDTDEGRANVDSIIAQQDQLAIERTNVAVVSTTNLPLRLEHPTGQWPRTSYADYGGHVTPRGAIIAGYLADQALDGFDAIPAHPSGPAVADFGDLLSPDGGSGGEDSESAEVSPATFVVEDGTVVADANSYCTVAFADDYFANYGAPSTWTSSTTAQKEEALRIGTEWVDRKYAQRWKGTIVDSDQALEWPRSSVMDDSGRWVDSDEIPSKLKRSVCIVALKHRLGVELWPDIDADQIGVASESVKVDVIDIATTYRGVRQSTPSFPQVEQLLRGLLMDGMSRLMVRVYR